MNPQPTLFDGTNGADKLPAVTLWTDGACSGNPGPGGWAYLLRHETTGREKQGSGSEPATTNNRMEMQAAIEGLKALKTPCRVTLKSDSTIITFGVARKSKKWAKRRAAGQVGNADLWDELDELCRRHTVIPEWVRGHSGDPGNEACNELAQRAVRRLTG